MPEQDSHDWGKHQLMVVDKLGRLEREYERSQERVTELEKELFNLKNMDNLLHEIKDEVKIIREKQILQQFKTSAIGSLSGAIPVFVYLVWELLSKR